MVASSTSTVRPHPLLSPHPSHRLNTTDPPAHAILSWYNSITAYTGNNPDPLLGGGHLSPPWNLTSHLSFMRSLSISHSIFSITSPSANAYMGDAPRTIALARLLNEHLAARSRTHPSKFHFLAAIPLPYTEAAVRELRYAVKEFGAVGVTLMSNHEGHYLGDAGFTPFWRELDGFGGRQVVYVHPSTSYMRVNGSFIPALPYTALERTRMEFYMETARTFIDLTITQTLHNFTNIHYILPHAGGAFPTMIDRVLRTVHTGPCDSSLEIYRTRFWWDSASPTYLHQIAGLLAYDIPPANLLFGSDYPFINATAPRSNLQSMLDHPGLGEVEKMGILSRNYRALFRDMLVC